VAGSADADGFDGMTYAPKPFDTSTVELPETLGPLVELLAENAHDTWAQMRIAEGWRYGQCRFGAHSRRRSGKPPLSTSRSRRPNAECAPFHRARLPFGQLPTLKRPYGWDCTRLDDVDVHEPGYMGSSPQI
jgi:RyR domain